MSRSSPEYTRAYRRKNLATVVAGNREYRKRNPDKVRQWAREGFYRNKDKPEYILRVRLLSRFYAEIKRGNATRFRSALLLMGCNLSQLVAHVEAQFSPRMSWKNCREWHLDHIVPLACFDLHSLDEQLRAFHFSNLRPLFAKDNYRKGCNGPMTERMIQMREQLRVYRELLGI